MYEFDPRGTIVGQTVIGFSGEDHDLPIVWNGSLTFQILDENMKETLFMWTSEKKIEGFSHAQDEAKKYLDLLRKEQQAEIDGWDAVEVTRLE